MKYTRINDYHKVAALEERISQLEQAHYSNEVYKIEALGIGDEAAVKHFTDLNAGIDVQWSVLEKERLELVELLEKANPIQEEDSDHGGELRG